MSKHIIRDYDQARIRLTQLTQLHSAGDREYKFAVGDLFNEVIPPGAASPKFAGTMGLDPIKFTQYIGREVDRLLEESGAAEYISRASVKRIRGTARAWKKSERTFNVAYSVYVILASHKDLMRDGITLAEATRAIAEARGRQRDATSTGVSEATFPEAWVGAGPRELDNGIRKDRERATVRRYAFNQTQWLTITANQLAGQLAAFSKGHKDEGSPFSGEDVEKVREMYRTLDEFVTENDIEHIWDLDAVTA